MPTQASCAGRAECVNGLRGLGLTGAVRLAQPHKPLFLDSHFRPAAFLYVDVSSVSYQSHT